MKPLTLLFILILLFMFAGCNDTPFVPDDYGTPPPENLEGNPVTIDDEMVFVSAYEGSIDVTVQSHTRDAFFWGANLTATSPVDWIVFSGPAEEVEPYGSTAFNLKVYREGLVPGSYGEYCTLWYNDRFMQYVNVIVQVGTPDAVPIGVANNYIRIPAETEVASVGLYNNSDETWYYPISHPGRFEISEHWLKSTSHIFFEVPPGETSAINLEVDRDGLQPGFYDCQIELFWHSDLVQTVYVEMEVGE